MTWEAPSRSEKIIDALLRAYLLRVDPTFVKHHWHDIAEAQARSAKGLVD